MWPGLGEVFFEALKKTAPEIAISVWQGSKRDVEDWMTSGLSDVAFLKTPLAAQRFESIRLANDEQILVATDPNANVTYNPDYVFVEAGDDFGREHATAYSNADTARISFNSVDLALEHIQNSNGSGYFPRRVVQQKINQGTLFELSDAQIFEVPAFIVVNSTAKAQWDWFEDVVTRLPNYPLS